MVLRLTIEPDGSVSLCEVKSTDMDAPSLSKQVAARVKRFDFGANEPPGRERAARLRATYDDVGRELFVPLTFAGLETSRADELAAGERRVGELLAP